MIDYPRPRYNVNTLRSKVHEALRAHDPKKTGPAPSVDNLTQAVFLMLTAGMSVKDIASVLERSPGYVTVIRRKLTLRMGVAPKRETREKVSPETKAATKAERKILAGIPDHSIEQLAALLEQLPPPNGWGLDAATLKKLGFEP